METTYDVIVVGGGPAGTGAALAAAENGAHVLLLEGTGRLGGMAVQALVGPFLGGIRRPHRTGHHRLPNVLPRRDQLRDCRNGVTAASPRRASVATVQTLSVYLIQPCIR